jgi:peptidoglycan/LPS O-acetylase OafA/YrhL
LFAALAVVVGHATTHLKISFLWVEPGDRLWFRDGVPLFFILSGYLVYKSCIRCIEGNRSIWQFYMNRFLRVAPAIYAYVIVTLILLLLTGVLAVESLSTLPIIGWLASTFALVPVYHPSTLESFGVGVLNGSLWTIPVESSFYVALPLAALVAHKFGFRRMMILVGSVALVGLLSSWSIRAILGEGLISKLYGVTFLPYLVFFAAGIFWSRYWERASRGMGMFIASLIGYVAVRFGLAEFYAGYDELATVFWTIPLSYAILWFGHFGPRALSKFTDRLGDLSYAVYIWHMIVINFVIHFDIVVDRSWVWDTVTVLSVIAVSMAIAYASWHLVEKQALKLKPYTSRATGMSRAVSHVA